MPRWSAPGRLGWGVALEGRQGWRERRREGVLLRAAPTERGDTSGGRGSCGTFPAPHHHPPLSKPPEAPPAPVPQFPLSKCGHPLACLSRGNGSICQALWNLKRRAPPREWLLLMHGGAGERGFARSGALSLGKEVTLRRRRTAVTHIVGGGRVGGDTAEGAFLPSPHPESALRRWGRHRAPLAHFGVRQVPWHLPGDLRLAADQDSCPSHLAWVG